MPNNKIPISDYKYKQWVCTIKTKKNGLASDLPPIDIMLKVFKALFKSHTFQLEMGAGGMFHYQCCFETGQKRSQKYVLEQLSKDLDYPLSLIEVDRSFDFEAAVDYCSDEAKRDLGAEVYTTRQLLPTYDESDITLLDDKSKRFPWQNQFMDLFFNEDETALKDPDDRKVYWLRDPAGCSGKSKFAKWLVCRYDSITKVAFGTSVQLRASIIDEGPQKLYIIDIPRTLGSEDSMSSLISVLEDLKNGYIKSGMYGKAGSLMMHPPHVMVFSNFAPDVKYLSGDRWCQHFIKPSKEWWPS